MATTKAQQEAVHKYVRNNYDRMELTVPKGERDRVKAEAKRKGKSVNGYIWGLISADMDGTPQPEREEGPDTAPASLLDCLDAESRERATQAAEKAGETVEGFIERAIRNQAERDEQTRRIQSYK